MLDMEIFGAKLREHRKNLGLTQEETAKRVGVSAQAVSKWESGECLPDCFNLKALGELYGISLDILLETERCDDIDSVAAKIEQIADEYLWAHQYRDAPNAHRELGSDIWKLWKGIYFIETGNRERQREDYAAGNLRVCSDYGLKIWDDDGVACVIRTDLREKLGSVGDREYRLLSELSSPDGLRLISRLDTVKPVTKETLSEESGIGLGRLNELLLSFIESDIVEYVNPAGYKLCGHFGIAAYMVLAAAFILSKKKYTLSEYLPGF